MAKRKAQEQVETPAAEAETVEQSIQEQVETPAAGKLRYRVVNARCGHDVGKLLEYDKAPDELFLRCLEQVK